MIRALRRFREEGAWPSFHGWRKISAQSARSLPSTTAVLRALGTDSWVEALHVAANADAEADRLIEQSAADSPVGWRLRRRDGELKIVLVWVDGRELKYASKIGEKGEVELTEVPWPGSFRSMRDAVLLLHAATGAVMDLADSAPVPELRGER